jgi:hypothetical protein
MNMARSVTALIYAESGSHHQRVFSQTDGAIVQNDIQVLDKVARVVKIFLPKWIRSMTQVDSWTILTMTSNIGLAPPTMAAMCIRLGS